MNFSLCRQFARSYFFSTAGVAMLSATILAGCNASGSGLVQVTGSITVDGKPAEGAVLLFHPEQPGSVAAGSADANGKFTLVTDMQPGISPGRYKVTATWPDPKLKTTAEDAMMGKSRDAPDLLKSRFVMRDRSGLSAEITSATTQLPPFELKSN